MKEQLHTIPINDAMANAGECPFCYIERRTEERAMDFVLGNGASYMEKDIRDMTDRDGFCRAHFKKMFDYGNALGSAWILKTLYMRHMEEFEKELKNFKPDSSPPKSIFARKNQGDSANSIVNWINKREDSCFICNMVDKTFHAYMNTFFEMYKKDPAFKNEIKNTKGFCLDHFKILLTYADQHLKDKEKSEFYNIVLPQMSENLSRVFEDVSWFVEKFDYQNKEADWKDSKDAVQRGMQKLRGSDPSAPPYRMKK